MDTNGMSDHMKLTSHHPADDCAALAWPVGAIPQHWIESLFNKMTFSYGVRFLDQWRGIDPDGIKRHWAQQLGVLSDQELCAGVLKLKTRDWPPTLPEFIKLCRPGVDPVVAFHEALEQGGRRERGEPDEWSTPAIFWAWRKIGVFDFSRLPYAVIKPRWEAALAAEMEKSPLEPIPAQMVALPAPGKSKLSVERAKLLLGDFKVKGMGDAAIGDSRRWARLIMERKGKGEQFSIFVVESAEKELGMR